MREITFRLRVDNKIVGYVKSDIRPEGAGLRWWYSRGNDINGTWSTVEIAHTDKDQFIGLPDKNGTEIYGGDILRLLNTVNGSCGDQQLYPHFIGEVFWHKEDCRFLVKGTPWEVPENELPIGTMQPNNVGTFCRGTVGSWVCVIKEVIGNVYENKGLLDG